MQLTRLHLRALGLAAALALAACGAQADQSAPTTTSTSSTTSTTESTTTTSTTTTTTQPRRLRVGVVGDSVGLTLTLRAGRVDEVEIRGGGHLGCGVVPRDECPDWEANWLATTAVDPDVVLISLGPWEVTDETVDGVPYVPETPEAEALLDRQLARAIEMLPADVPLAVLDVPCLSNEDDTAQVPDSRIRWINGIFADWVESLGPRAHLVPVSELVCPGGVEAVVDGVEMRFDGRHYSFESAPLAWDWLIPRLQEIAS